MSDRKLGYLIIIFLFAFLIVPLAYIAKNVFGKVYTRTIEFNEINTSCFVRIEDPVCIHGYTIGTVHAIAWQNKKSIVTIITKKPLAMYSNYSIIAVAKGLMGDRYLEIDPGDSSRARIDEKMPLFGTFPMGPTEAMANMARLSATVTDLIHTTEMLKTGNTETPSLIDGFNSVIFRLDTLFSALQIASKSIDDGITKNMDSLAKMATGTVAIAEALESMSPVTIQTLEKILTNSDNLLITIATLLTQSDKIMREVNSADLARLHTDINDLHATIKTIRNYVNDIRKQGFNLPVKLN